MTPAYIIPQKETRTYRFSIFRVITVSVLLFLLTTACLYLHKIIMEEYVSYLTTAEKKSTAFLAEQISYMLPFLAVAIFQYAVYAKHDNRDGILQKEQAYEILILAALTYLLLLPGVWIYSDKTLTLQLAADIEVAQNGKKAYQTLLLDLFQWFVRFIIPVCLLFTYHILRAKAEIAENAKTTVESAPIKAEAASKIHDSTAETSDILTDNIPLSTEGEPV